LSARATCRVELPLRSMTNFCPPGDIGSHKAQASHPANPRTLSNKNVSSSRIVVLV